MIFMRLRYKVVSLNKNVLAIKFVLQTRQPKNMYRLCIDLRIYVYTFHLSIFPHISPPFFLERASVGGLQITK